MKRRLVQIAPGVNPGDAITNEIRIIADLFRRPPCDDLFSETAVYAEHIHPSLLHFAGPAHSYVPQPGDFILYHYGIAARISERIRSWSGVQRALIYHNVTPAEYYRPYSLYVAGRLERARRDLRRLRDDFDLAFADSRFNAEELEAFGYSGVRVLPVLFPVAQSPYSNGRISGDATASNRAVHQTNGKAVRSRDLDDSDQSNILFVGRIAPNKGHVDLIKIFYYLHKLEPRARLILAGDVATHARSYREELDCLVRSLDLSESVEFTGFVSDARLAELYGQARLFCSASAHEGFCVPLLEAMRYDVPVLAYASPHSAVGETLRGAGVEYHRIRHPAVAEMALTLLRDGPLRRGVVERQRLRIRSHINREIFETKLYAVVRDHLRKAAV